LKLYTRPAGEGRFASLFGKSGDCHTFCLIKFIGLLLSEMWGGNEKVFFADSTSSLDMVNNPGSAPKLDEANGAMIAANVPPLDGLDAMRLELVKGKLLESVEGLGTNITHVLLAQTHLGRGGGPMGDQVGNGATTNSSNTSEKSFPCTRYVLAPVFKTGSFPASECWEKSEPMEVF